MAPLALLAAGTVAKKYYDRAVGRRGWDQNDRIEVQAPRGLGEMVDGAARVGGLGRNLIEAGVRQAGGHALNAMGERRPRLEQDGAGELRRAEEVAENRLRAADRLREMDRAVVGEVVRRLRSTGARRLEQPVVEDDPPEIRPRVGRAEMAGAREGAEWVERQEPSYGRPSATSQAAEEAAREHGRRLTPRGGWKIWRVYRPSRRIVILFLTDNYNIIL